MESSIMSKWSIKNMSCLGHTIIFGYLGVFRAGLKFKIYSINASFIPKIEVIVGYSFL